MNAWASPLHYRLYLQGHNGRARQRIIDMSTNWHGAGLMVDALDLGMFLASSNVRQIDNLAIKMPPVPWYVESWLTMQYWGLYLWPWAGMKERTW